MAAQERKVTVQSRSSVWPYTSNID